MRDRPDWPRSFERTTRKPVQFSQPSKMKASSRAIFFVSDGTGITAETLGKGLLSQFEGINFRQIRFPFVDNPEKAAECQSRIREVREQDGVRPLVVMTMMNPKISAMLRQEDALFLDLFEVFIAPLEKELGVRSAHTVGRSHGQRQPRIRQPHCCDEFRDCTRRRRFRCRLEKCRRDTGRRFTLRQDPDQLVSVHAVWLSGRQITR